MLGGYSISEDLYQGRRHAVRRAVRERDQVPVIIKSLVSEVPSAEEVAGVRREYEILSSLHIDGVVGVHELRAEASSLDLVLEDAGGTTLADYARSSSWDLVERLEIAIRIVEILAAVHRAGVIHKDVTPRNILVRPDSGEVTLIDFSIATRRPEEYRAASHPSLLEGTPAYLSPEQTGRMNRPIDHRTDFYSLGVTLFELLTGTLPFEADDSMGLIHCHLAVPPPAASDVRPGVPRPVSAVLDKLLQKAPEDRYQSATGIVEDLRRCLEIVIAGDVAGEFVPGTRDVSDRFLIPRTLYGRSREIEVLLDAFQRVCRGTREIVLVSGYSGIGKSSLVNEVQKPITARQGHFVAGKFDQLRRTVPYSAVVGAITSLSRQLLTGSDEELAAWRETLMEAVAGNGQVVVDVIPEVERIIGPQPPVEELRGPAARDRFHLTFQRFIRAFCDASHPLVLFLDDLQWADTASLSLVETILCDEDTQHLLVIGAYRDNEVDDAHPLTSAIEALAGKGAAITGIALDPLGPEQVTAFLEDALHTDTEAVRPLEQLLSRKTGGNPFFLREFLLSLRRAEQLVFDHDEGRWSWDVAEIESMNITANVVDLMVRRLRDLPEETQSVLRLAACIGNRFDLGTLEIIRAEQSRDEVADLAPAIEAGLVLAAGGASRDRDDGPTATAYRFLHDRVHQAAYSLIDESMRRSVHLEIGRQLVRSVEDPAADERLFEIVDHLDVGPELIEDPAELDELARLNLAAARKAISATAYGEAAEYATQGLACAGQDAWTDDYQLAKALHRVRADAAYLSGDFEDSERVVHGMLQRLETPAEQAELHNLLLIQQTLSGQYGRATETARSALSLLDVDLPASDLGEALQAELRDFRSALGNRRPSDLIAAPEVTSRAMRVALELLGNLCPLCYIANPELCRLAAAKMVNISLRHGHTADSAIGYAFFGLLHSSLLHDYSSAYEYGRLAMALSERFSSASQRCRTSHVFCAFINHWTRPLHEMNAVNSDGFHAGVQSGELQFAGYHRYNRALCRFHQGVNLDDLQPELEELASFGRKTRNEHATDPIVAVQRVVMDLTGQTPQAGSFDVDGADDRAFLDDLARRGAVPTLCHYDVLKSQALYLYGDLAGARRCAAAAAERLPFVQGHVSVAVQCFYESLILAGIAGQGPAAGREELLERLRHNQQRMDGWAGSCAANFAHKASLMEAELARLGGDHWEAADLYDRAIEQASRSDYPQEEALARELAGRFWLEKGRRKLAAVYLREAHHAYRLWGATRKADLLERVHGQLLKGAPTGEPSSARTAMPYLTLVSSTGAALDFATIMKAARTISAEIDLQTLTEKLVRMAVENAGAQRGCLLLQRGDEIRVEADTRGAVGEPPVRPPRPLDEADLAVSVINYAVRTQDVVVVPDAAADPRFGSDPYVVEHQPKSVLCVPIVRQSRLLGLLYLEHNMATDVFTEDRVGVLQGLASQAAVSLENARLYDQQKRTEQELRDTLAEVERLKVRLEAENRYLQEEIKLNHGFEEIVGDSRAIQEVLEAVETVAPTNANVLITGETGTGKELIARAVHNLSERRDRPLIKVNCATIPKDLFESEFFGHIKGAFTGAVKTRAGRFELADRGTLFLDEVAEIPIDMQSKLLRVLQEGQFERVGGDTTHEVDVRIIAATNRDLDVEVEHGRFRQDLYYRLNVFPIHVPPLRDRRDDIPLLAAHFVKRAAAEMKCPRPDLRKVDVERLQAHDWPGNVRELQNIVERALIAARDGRLRFALPDGGGPDGGESPRDRAPRAAPSPAPSNSADVEDIPLDVVERDHILRVLEANDGNKAKTARDLGIDPKTLYKRLRDYGVMPPRQKT